ncbi:TetR/AcrR family transcriptional regulator [Winogradskyella sp. SYSU M77433]|uniref:TetR/AcrR family transcriptional regulator n=1 Tax=Winogradskyella sp. SYSU M77433 TaxID=3042722 RepID=UPI002480155A|nr:TetR/AcrR family transcriptional regulator [Winogradskyella sp. SYSU M77433]MDH7912240.1 TetR/AcrR family transcriptional regulator [Winogradskyella sp. SYSU M77433]
MIDKYELIKTAIDSFTKFGSKRYTLDELATSVGISKKTIYKYFRSKEHLVVESVAFLLDEFRDDVNEILKSHNDDPITCIILIYKKGFENLKHFKPSFIFGLKKYYPKANEIFDDFRNEIVNQTVYGLLEKASKNGTIRPEVNLSLFCSLYFKRFEEVALRNNNLMEIYTNKELLNHFVVYSLKGISVSDYKNAYFE